MKKIVLCCLVYWVVLSFHATADLTGKMLWVDSINGNDGTGTRGDASKPYASCLAAQNAAQSGDTIVVRPGNYTSINLGKNGLNWDFIKGATLSPGAGNAVFSNGGTSPSFDITGYGEVLNGMALNIQSSSGVIRAQFLKISGGVTVMGATVYLTVLEDVTGDVFSADSANFTFKCRKMVNGTLWIFAQPPYVHETKVYADAMVNVGVYQDIGGGRTTGKADLYVKQITGPDTTNGQSQGYAVLADDGYLVLHDCEIRNGASNKLVGMDLGVRLIMENCTIIRTAGNNYCVDRHGGGVNDVIRIIGRLTSNAPLDPGISPYWSGQFVQDGDINY